MDWSLDHLLIEEKEAEHMLAGGWLGLAVGTIARQHNHGDQGPPWAWSLSLQTLLSHILGDRI